MYNTAHVYTEPTRVTARIIDGRAAAALLRAEFVPRIERLRERTNITPGLAVLLVGNNPASAIYVSNKVTACDQIGIRSLRFDLPESTDTETLVRTIEGLNADPAVHGILVQLPLPQHIDMRRVLDADATRRDSLYLSRQDARSGAVHDSGRHIESLLPVNPV